MARLTVSVQEDHLDSLVRGPFVALSELIWNALDADAEEVRVEIEENIMGGTAAIVVSDDGTGITLDQAKQEFGQLGGSWKKFARTTRRGRTLHGRFGRGRWAAYGLGSVVRWRSTVEAEDGSLTQITIAGRQSSLKEFQISEPRRVDLGWKTGTSVTIDNVNERADALLNRNSTRNDLTSAFALYLAKYPVTVTYLGTELDPEAAQASRTEIPLKVAGVQDSVALTVIEWRMNVDRALHICDETGVSLDQIQPGIKAPGFSFTAYLSWQGFREHHALVHLGEMVDGPVPRIVHAAKDALRSHFNERAAQRRTALVQGWKDDNTYPYRGEPSNLFERAERELFDVVALAAAPAVEGVERKSRALSLRLLKETLETSPESLQDVLAEVLILPESQLKELRELLQRTSFSSIIASARAITDRLDFLVGLEEIVFEPELKKKTKERSQLHRILANETWVFREEYALTADDATLTTALKAHTHLLGRKDLVPADLESGEVLDVNGNRAVVDLLLSRVIEHHADHREHVVIELKRPSVHIGETELSQIKKYAHAVHKDARFATTDTRWEFWIIGDDVKDEIELDINQQNRDPGVAVQTERMTVRVLTWAQIIQAARHRLRFVQRSLSYKASTGTGMDYLRRTHEKYLPLQRVPTDNA
ncbi:ATP-binding protein [Glycomyces sp. A-F 0318]|uniref:ATP-binding protein n=1 Tax=Glycomyces amatae TaxID=2881355 RepID=UPI001E4E9F1C|nr:ATP-binding protein [Glycomyces amatae]MCD0444243.1 ATP-binding protein [Glycomyces amatae]